MNLPTLTADQRRHYLSLTPTITELQATAAKQYFKNSGQPGHITRDVQNYIAVEVLGETATPIEAKRKQKRVSDTDILNALYKAVEPLKANIEAQHKITAELKQVAPVLKNRADESWIAETVGLVKGEPPKPKTTTEEADAAWISEVTAIAKGNAPL